MSHTEVDFAQERGWWDTKADSEDSVLADELINQELRWRVIERYLNGVRTILEVGGGTGAFSIPLAKRGFAVTHVDFSPRMLERAKERATGVGNIIFQQANSTDLQGIPDMSMDLVLNMDGAISFCGNAAERAIEESCRVAKETLIVSVSNRSWMIPVWIMESIERSGKVLPAVHEMMNDGFWHKSQFAENNLLANGYLGTLKAYLPHELREQIEKNGMNVVELRSIGSLANLCAKVIPDVSKDRALWNDFVDLCEAYDTRISPEGPGTRQRAGLLAVAQRANLHS